MVFPGIVQTRQDYRVPVYREQVFESKNGEKTPFLLGGTNWCGEYVSGEIDRMYLEDENTHIVVPNTQDQLDHAMKDMYADAFKLLDGTNSDPNNLGGIIKALLEDQRRDVQDIYCFNIRFKRVVGKIADNKVNPAFEFCSDAYLEMLRLMKKKARNCRTSFKETNAQEGLGFRYDIRGSDLHILRLPKDVQEKLIAARRSAAGEGWIFAAEENIHVEASACMLIVDVYMNRK